jgi:hypothetical protein
VSDVLNAVPPEDLARLALAILVLFAKGERLSSILMPGWTHDKEMAECERREASTRRFYEDQLAELRRQTEVRVGEVRGYREEAMASNATLLASLDSATRDITAMLRLLEQLADRGGARE